MNGEVAAKRLKALRMVHRLTRPKLAHASGVSTQTLMRMENNPDYWDSVSESTLTHVADALDVVPDYFLDENIKEVSNGSDKGNASVSQKNDLQANPAFPPALQVHKPIREDMDELPLMAHTNETWNDQGLCFLEHVRLAFMHWANSDERSADVLMELVDDEVSKWAINHGIPFQDDDVNTHDTDNKPSSSSKTNNQPPSPKTDTPPVKPQKKQRSVSEWEDWL